MNIKPNPDKLAPTWLRNRRTWEKKLFRTQDEVDAAWRNGWFAPDNLLDASKLLSETLTMDNTAREIREAVAGDPRYNGLTFSKTTKKPGMLEMIIRFEVESGLMEAKQDSEIGE